MRWDDGFWAIPLFSGNFPAVQHLTVHIAENHNPQSSWNWQAQQPTH
jgi:hypothetical protein